jgi:hypothetical protein
MPLRLWEVPISDGTILRDPLVLVQQLGHVRTPSKKQQIDRKELAYALERVTQWGRRQPARGEAP